MAEKDKPVKKEEAPARKEEPKAEAPKERPAEKKEEPKKVGPKSRILLFNRWDVSDVKVEDAGLQKYMNVEPIIVPRTGGKFTRPSVHKAKMSVVERFMNKLQVPGHRGKKHKIYSGQCCGNVNTIYRHTKEAFSIIEKRTNQNPLQVLVKAIENSAPLEEVAAYRLGGIIARKSVVTSPQRRLDLALRHLTQGIYKVNFRSKRPLSNVIASELIAASEGDAKNMGVSEKLRLEKEAEGAR